MCVLFARKLYISIWRLLHKLLRSRCLDKMPFARVMAHVLLFNANYSLQRVTVSLLITSTVHSTLNIIPEPFVISKTSAK